MSALSMDDYCSSLSTPGFEDRGAGEPGWPSVARRPRRTALIRMGQPCKSTRPAPPRCLAAPGVSGAARGGNRHGPGRRRERHARAEHTHRLQCCGALCLPAAAARSTARLMLRARRGLRMLVPRCLSDARAAGDRIWAVPRLGRESGWSEQRADRRTGRPRKGSCQPLKAA